MPFACGNSKRKVGGTWAAPRRTNKGTLTLPRSTTPRRSNSSLDCADHTSDVAPELGRSAQSIIDSLPPSTSQPANGCTPPPNTSDSANPQHELKGAHPSPESQITKADTYNPQIPDPATPVPDLLESLAEPQHNLLPNGTTAIQPRLDHLLSQAQPTRSALVASSSSVPAQIRSQRYAPSGNDLPFIFNAPLPRSSSKRKCEPEDPVIRRRDRLNEFPKSFTHDRLKKLLKQVGITPLAKARQTTLAKLYSRHLIKSNVSTTAKQPILSFSLHHPYLIYKAQGN
ncbi:hypothetical protein VP01_169g1 [Puccinia sorghi]|uniref:Uncharacterized protein n=1 Tax=Puccinia sorghi TaxID=27349 RepID=A0A0L6VGA1_9BASI|nr:hypothetical protein VP01_169g1 [Puccinia sorghi]